LICCCCCCSQRTLRNTFEHEPAKDTVARRQAQQDPQLLALHLEAQGKKQQQFEDFRRTLAQQVEAKTVAKMRQREADCAFAAKMKEDALRAEQEEQRRVAERRQRSMENRAFLEEQIRAKKLAAPGRHAGSIAFSAPAALQLPQPQQLPPPPQQQQQQQQQQTRSTRPW
jgi:C4-dicarboxylate-specific signal transduction histidine kinase